MDISKDNAEIEQAILDGKISSSVGAFLQACALVGYQTLAVEGEFPVTAIFKLPAEGPPRLALLPQHQTPFEDKDLFMLATRHFGERTEAEHVAIVSECWTVIHKVEGNETPPPITQSLAEHPDAREALIVLSEDNGNHIHLSYNIERGPDENISAITFESLKITPERETVGRLTKLRLTDEDRKDPNFETMQKAMDAVVRHQTGLNAFAPPTRERGKHGLN